MTPDELEVFRFKVKIVALQALLDFVANVLRLRFLFSPPAEQQASYESFRKKMEDARRDYESMTFPELPPEMSDLQAAEFQEAFDSASRYLEKKVCDPTPRLR